MTQPILKRRAGLFGLALLLCVVAALYWPALHSGYFLDDYFNLAPLEQIGTAGYSWFIFGGVAGPTGRPLSLLSFALQHAAWPSDPFAFKLVNLLLHLLITGLIYCFARLAAKALSLPAGRTGAFALAVCGLWALQPMLADTVLYVVQRMTELSALFIMAGICGFMLGRLNYPRWSPRRCYLVMSVSIVLATTLAAFSKENGVLLPLFASITDVTLLRQQQRPPRYRIWRGVFLLLPLLAILGYFMLSLAPTLHSYIWRPYSPWQKLITEGRVLMVYLRNLVLPHPGAFGLFHDDFPVSRGLLSPPTTLPACLAIILLVGSAIGLRKRAPVFGFAVLWFFGGHVIESTFVNLDIYFEHRNYLPSLGVVFLLVWAVHKLLERRSLRLPVAIAALGYSALVAGVTWQNVQLWRKPLLQAEMLAQRHPKSPRALVNLENRLIATDDLGGALQLLDQIESQFPEQVYPDLKRIAINGCALDKPIDSKLWQTADRKAAAGKRQVLENIGEIATLVPLVAEGNCPHIDHHELVRLIVTLARHGGNRAGAFYELAATLGLRFGDLAEGYANLVKAVHASPTVHRRVYLLEVSLALHLPKASANAYKAVRRELDKDPVTYLAYREKMRKLKRELQALQHGLPNTDGDGDVPGSTEPRFPGDRTGQSGHE